MVGSTELGEEKIFSFVAGFPMSQLKGPHVSLFWVGVIRKVCSVCMALCRPWLRDGGSWVAASLPGLGKQCGLAPKTGWEIRTLK